ncbi:hypothetical protein CC86DRAFT_470685 [Ophiobolus disseminans]|uniref:Phospholipid/glycerol acyltransferase domain-containing protein n=1 Tax=Ophiobolus disseminans TaxID=1469910 RepID=A0A6A6ZK65_9PLEO|nr:hypothetical protein CC86DRAFT_470685 [Ophiobolus disseminans]
MEKYSQFRDKGTSIAPFLPVPPAPTNILWTIVSVCLFLFRLPLLLGVSILYFGLLEWIPIGSRIKYGALWMMISIPGVWWVDLQVDRVKRGDISRLSASSEHLPHAGTIVASSFTSPLDPLYLAGIFQPIFTRAYPHTRKVERITLFSAIRLAFAAPQIYPNDESKLVTLEELTNANPNSVICVFPETTTTNGRAILPLSPCLLSASPKTAIYAVNLRYTPQDITTPIPGQYAYWLWSLLNKPTHQMRVRIATAIYNTPTQDSPNASPSRAVASGYDTNIFDGPAFRENGGSSAEGAAHISPDEQRVLDRVGEDLARLGRVKRVGLGVEEKINFLRIWAERKR